MSSVMTGYRLGDHSKLVGELKNAGVTALIELEASDGVCAKNELA